MTSRLFASLALVGIVAVACGKKEDLQGSCTGNCSASGGEMNVPGDPGNGSSTGGAQNDTPAGECAKPADEEVSAAPEGATAQLQGDDSIEVTLRTNHLGYAAEGTKRAVVAASGSLSSFQIIRASDQSVRYEGELTSLGSFDAWGSSQQHYVADFTTLREDGTFQLLVNGQTSEEFRIGARIHFDATFTDVLGFFNGSRADEADVWAADAAIPKEDSGGSYDVRGGWYDASGDISKYLSHLSYANFMNPQQIPLTAWALAWVHDEAGDLLTAKGLKSQVQDEALWGADYLVRVLDPDGYFYINVFDGWTGELPDRRICAFAPGQEGEMWTNGAKNANYQAALREGGGMSIAALARIASWGVTGSFAPAEYLAAAEKGFAHLVDNNTSYCDDGKENVIDDYTALMAAAELFATTQNADYLTAARSRASALSGRMHTEGYFIADDGSRPFWHAADAGLPVVALVRYAEVETDAEERRNALDTVERHLDYLLDVTSEVTNPYGYARQHVNTGGGVRTSFFIPHDNETGYWWQGESARLGSLATAALLGGRAVASADGCPGKASREQVTYAIDQIDWILGKNPLDMSFLQGTGRNHPPGYCAHKPQHSTLDGGISNGITGSETDGSGFQWMTGGECWENWRWVEQWLPHSTWYMMAITAAAL